MDIRIDGQSFQDTEAVVSWESEKGKKVFAEMFGECVVSVNMPKSRALDFGRFCEQHNLEVVCP